MSLPSRKKRRRCTRTGEAQLEESHTREEPAMPVSKSEMKAEAPLEPKKVQEQVEPPPQQQQQLVNQK